MSKQIVRLCIFFLSVPGFLFAQDAREIVKRADEHAKGKTSEAVMTIQIVRPSWTREMSMKTWTKGNDLALILLTSPAKDKGTVFLKRKKEVWNWVPAIERNIKLPPSMMSQSWMGTDFTNDDLVKEASIVEDYNHSIIGEETLQDRSCYKIEMIPKPEAAVVWGKIILWIDKKDFLMLKAEYYDEENMLVNTMTTSDIKMLGGKLLPSRMETIPADKKGNKTVLIYTSLLFDKEINDDFFSTQNMQKVK
jgi:outer membrane lipoprotein-sorting protein